MALRRNETENGLISEENVIQAIASTYTLLLGCVRPLGTVPTPPKPTQHAGQVKVLDDFLTALGCIHETNKMQSSINKSSVQS